ncbi:MAG TPA: hypothetical protein VGD40_11530 [Chryseosolibacter sp.]
MKLAQLSFVCLMFVGLACDDKNEKDQSAATAKIVEVENRAINGQQWRITNYTESNVDQTASFNGYIFEFDSNNLLTVTNGSDNIAGTWSVVADNSDDDNDSKSEFDDIDFNLMFTNPEMFAELTEDWEILSINDTKIELRHSSDNGRLDLLTFERI